MRCYRADKDSKEFGSMDCAIYQEVSSKNPEISKEDLVSRSFQVGIKTFIEVSIESLEEENLRRRNNTR